MTARLSPSERIPLLLAQLTPLTTRQVAVGLGLSRHYTWGVLTRLTRAGAVEAVEVPRGRETAWQVVYRLPQGGVVG